jgi:translation initiation factor 4G
MPRASHSLVVSFSRCPGRLRAWARWLAKKASASSAATKVTEEQVFKEAKEKTNGEEPERHLDEDYAAAKARRRTVLGLYSFRSPGAVQFMLQILKDRDMHECIKNLLAIAETPEEEEIESLCTAVGSLLDTQRARAHLDLYFSRMRESTGNKDVNARVVLML